MGEWEIFEKEKSLCGKLLKKLCEKEKKIHYFSKFGTHITLNLLINSIYNITPSTRHEIRKFS